MKVVFKSHLLAPGMMPAYIDDGLKGPGMRALRLQELFEPDYGDTTIHDVVIMETKEFLKLVGKNHA